MASRYITIKDFAKERGVSYNVITQYLYRRRKQDAKKGVKSEILPVRDGLQVIEIGSPLWDSLDHRYPKPTKPVEVIQNEELQQKLVESEHEAMLSWKKVAELQDQIKILQKQIMEEQSTRILLEQSNQERDNAIVERDNALNERDRYKKEAEESKIRGKEIENRAMKAEEKAAKIEKQVNNMQNSSLIKRIFKKW